MEAALNKIVQNPAYHDILAIIKGASQRPECVHGLPRLQRTGQTRLIDTSLVPCQLTGARNGFVYGVKVRFPHALIMSILFQSGE